MKHTDAFNFIIRLLLGLVLVIVAAPGVLGPNVCQAREWIEGQGSSILMVDGTSVYRSTDTGMSWNPISTLTDPAGYFTRLSDASLVTVAIRSGTGTSLGWIRSIDDGQSWSEYHSMIADAPPDFYYGPIIVSQSGRWTYCPAYRDANQDAHSVIMWSGDQGQSWSAPAEFPVSSDGNKGLSEANIAQIGANNFVAAIRADEGIPGAWDGFYLSHSQDGLNWSVPEPTAPGERGRMPLFYHIDNSYWLLSYRQYEASTGTQYAAARFSRDGQIWSEPHRFTSGVGTNGFFVESANQWYLFATSYPGGQIIRQPVDLDALANQLLPPVPEPSTLVLVISGLGGLGLHRWVRRRLRDWARIGQSLECGD